MKDNKPRVGVGVIVKQDKRVLLGNRINSHGHNTWNFPGGHLEFNESPFDCARREVKEETGLNITNLEAGPWTNDLFTNENKHYITIYIASDYFSGSLQVKEPHKCKQWAWFSWDRLPSPIFLPIQNLLKLQFNPFAS